MDNGSADSSSSAPSKASDVQPSAAADLGPNNSTHDAPSKLSTWAKSLKIPQPFAASQEDSPTGNAGKSSFTRFTSGLGLRSSPKSPAANDSPDGTSPTAKPGFLGTITKGIVDSSKNAVKAVQVKARHVVSQNKRRYQDKYKVYNLCCERLYDASLLEGKVASFPFDDHNCPPIQLIISFCQSAYSWLKEDIENVVVVHCKAGMARTGLMISSLLLYLKFFPTAEESMDYYNQKRCVDGKGLVLPSQIRYVKYFERTLTYFNGESPTGRRCMLRGFRLHRCPYWIRPSITVSDHRGVLFSTKKHPRTKDLSSEDLWFSAPKKGVMVFALPGEPGLTELAGDFKIHFHDRQGDFYCWLNTTMIENRKILNTGDLDWFDKRKLPSPGFQVEVVLVDYNGTVPTKPQTETATNKPDESSSTNAVSADGGPAPTNNDKDPGHNDKDDVFSDSEAEESGSSKNRRHKASSTEGAAASSATTKSDTNPNSDQVASLVHSTEQVSLGSANSRQNHAPSEPRKDVGEAAAAAAGVRVSSSESEFKAMAADASVFSFGDDEDYESE
ncbi:hypothetical protein PTKIN_Ptkin10aG0128600 [Pterospermum kingtungense]